MCSWQIRALEDQSDREQLSAETAHSRVNELTALHDAAQQNVDQLRQRNDLLNDQLTQLHRQVRVAMVTTTSVSVLCSHLQSGW